ncbi:hypothetical protein ACFOPX_02655 [Helicobacter baculiformis]|uniref:Uncharacterized protein n=1 Tax=Helicobacter baculiformis TaxID=427351 RepID=A0ABV7ZFU9_9HELI|nr:hypothetical protein [Helicobacter baculiformis]
MRCFFWVCALLPLGAQPLKIGNDLGNQEGFLDLLTIAYTSQKIVWIEPIPKDLCALDGLLVSKSTLHRLNLRGKLVFKELWLVLGKEEWKQRLHASNPHALAKALNNPTLAPHLQPMRTWRAYAPTDLLLLPARLYLQERAMHPFPPVLYRIYIGYFWAQPCKHTHANAFYKWLRSPAMKELLQGFRVDYQHVFAP